MVSNGKELLKNALTELQKLNITTIKSNNSIELLFLDNSKTDEIINYFLEGIESIPENKEHLLPKNILLLYNNIVDGNVSFDMQQLEDTELDIDEIIFRRTKFNA